MTDCLVRNSNLDCILLELAIRDSLIETLIVIRYCPLLTAVAGLCENAFLYDTADGPVESSETSQCELQSTNFK